MALQLVCLLRSRTLSLHQRQILEPKLENRGARVIAPDALEALLLERHRDAAPAASRVLLVVPDGDGVIGNAHDQLHCVDQALRSDALKRAAQSGATLVRQSWAHAAAAKTPPPLLDWAAYSVAASHHAAAAAAAGGAAIGAGAGPPAAPAPAPERSILTRHPAGFALAWCPCWHTTPART